MDGSGIDFVIIPVVLVPILAFWLIGMYYADSHAAWRVGPSGQREITAAATPAVAPPQAPVTVPQQVAAVILPQVAEPEAAAPAVEEA